MMNGNCFEGCGKFVLGLGTGMVAGTALGMSMTPSNRKIKRAAHKAAKRVNEAVENLAEAMEM